MPYVKLDCELLESSLWDWTPERHIFITALLMARPKAIDDPMPQLQVDSLEETGFVVPPGKYGFVNASGVMIIKKALGLSHADVLPDANNEYDDPFKTAMEALRCLGEPDSDSRSQAFDGRRLVRVDGGYIVLNYNRFRDKDHTAAERKQRQRAKESQDVTAVTNVKSQPVTQAEAEAEAEKTPLPPKGNSLMVPFDTKEFIAAWDAWVKYRKDKKQKLVSTTIEAQFAKLAKMGQKNAIAAINQSIEHGWTGLFEPKPENGAKAPVRKERRISADHPDERPDPPTLTLSVMDL